LKFKWAAFAGSVPDCPFTENNEKAYSRGFLFSDGSTLSFQIGDEKFIGKIDEKGQMMSVDRARQATISLRLLGGRVEVVSK
jgi:hypothetical protein